VPKKDNNPSRELGNFVYKTQKLIKQ